MNNMDKLGDRDYRLWINREGVVDNVALRQVPVMDRIKAPFGHGSINLVNVIENILNKFQFYFPHEHDSIKTVCQFLKNKHETYQKKSKKIHRIFHKVLPSALCERISFLGLKKEVGIKYMLQQVEAGLLEICDLMTNFGDAHSRNEQIEMLRDLKRNLEAELRQISE